MNDLEILSHSFLNPKHVQGKRDTLHLTSSKSQYRAELEKEVRELEERLEKEVVLKVRRSALLSAANAIPSKFSEGYVTKAVNGWIKITPEQIVAAAVAKGI